MIAFDGRGREWRCDCLDPAKTAARLRVHTTMQAPPLPHAITLAQSLPKGATMDEIVRQATELGAARIVPVLTERTQVHLDPERAAKKVDKWRVTAIEAAKQCGNPWVPDIAPVQTLEEWLKTFPNTAAAALRVAAGPSGDDHRTSRGGGSESHFDLKLVASLHAGTRTLRGVLDHYRTHHSQPPRTALWLVGPEGDFTPSEMTACITAGCVPVTLGPLVLRCDTAAVSALSLLAYELSA